MSDLSAKQPAQLEWRASLMANEQSVIVASVRTPIGAFLGGLAAVSAPQLGAACVRALIERTGTPAERVDEVLMGTCIAAGQGMNPARQSAILGGLPNSVHSATINEACASGLRAVMLADQILRANDAELIIAGGMESMSRAPYLLPKAREGYRLGNGEIIDSMMFDGLTDAYADQPMGCFADACAREFGTRPRPARRLRRPQPQPRPQGPRRERVRPRDRPGVGHSPRQDHDRHRGRGAVQVQRVQAARAAAGVRRRRHRHGRQRIEPQRRRGGPHGLDPREPAMNSA